VRDGTIKILSAALNQLADAFHSEQISYSEFVRKAWPIIEPATPLSEGYYIDFIAEHLEAVVQGQIRNLIINLPPRYGKSNLVTVMWPVWAWTMDPSLRFICASFSQRLATKHSLSRRRILNSYWFRANWGGRVQVMDDQDQKMEFENTARGIMAATSVGGTVTGTGGDVLIADDFLDPERARSKLVRENTIEFWDKTFSTRLDDKHKGAKVVVEQRLIKNDITGHITEKEDHGWTHVVLPAVCISPQKLIFPLSGKIVTRDVGDILCPARETGEEIMAQKKIMTDKKGSHAFEAQYQQNPTSDEGGMFKRDYWKHHTIAPQVVWKLWSWDTAMEDGEQNDWSVGILIAFHGQGACVERVVRVRAQYPELKRTVVSEWSSRPANSLLIEDTSSGKSLAQELIKTTDLPVIAVPVDGKDKVFRASLVSPYVEGGRVSLKEGEPWVPDFIEELAEFPNGEHDDQVDSFSQALSQYYLHQQRPAAAMVGGQLVTSGIASQSDWMDGGR